MKGHESVYFVERWDLKDRTKKPELLFQPKDYFFSFACSPDGRYLVGASGYPGCKVFLYDAESGELLKEHDEQTTATPQLGFSSDSRWYASLGSIYKTCRFSTETRECVATFEGKGEPGAIAEGNDDYPLIMLERRNETIVLSHDHHEFVAAVPSLIENITTLPDKKSWCGTSGGQVYLYALEDFSSPLSTPDSDLRRDDLRCAERLEQYERIHYSHSNYDRFSGAFTDLTEVRDENHYNYLTGVREFLSYMIGFYETWLNDKLSFLRLGNCPLLVEQWYTRLLRHHSTLGSLAEGIDVLERGITNALRRIDEGYPSAEMEENTLYQLLSLYVAWKDKTDALEDAEALLAESLKTYEKRNELKFVLRIHRDIVFLLYRSGNRKEAQDHALGVLERYGNDYSHGQFDEKAIKPFHYLSALVKMDEGNTESAIRSVMKTIAIHDRFCIGDFWDDPWSNIDEAVGLLSAAYTVSANDPGTTSEERELLLERKHEIETFPDLDDDEKKCRFLERVFRMADHITETETYDIFSIYLLCCLAKDYAKNDKWKPAAAKAVVKLAERYDPDWKYLDQCLFESAKWDREAGNAEAAKEQILRSIRIMKANYGTKYPDLKNAYWMLSLIESDREDYHAAKQALLRVLKLTKAVPQADDDVYTLIGKLGEYEATLGNVAKARPLLKHAIKKEREINGPNFGKLANRYTRLGDCEFSLEKFGRAARSYRQFLRVSMANADLNEINCRYYVDFYLSIARLERFRGNYATAKRDLLRGFRVLRSFGSDNPEMSAVLVGEAGVIETFLGSYRRAKELLEACLHAENPSTDPSHHNFSIRLLSLGLVEMLSGRHESAEQLIGRAYDVETKKESPDPVTVSLVLLRKGQLELERQGDPAEAERYLLQAIDILEANKTAPGYRLAEMRFALANVFQQGDQMEKAISQMRRAALQWNGNEAWPLLKKAEEWLSDHDPAAMSFFEEHNLNRGSRNRD